MYSKFSKISELSREDLEQLCKDLAKNLVLVSATRNCFSQEVNIPQFKEFRPAEIWKLHNEAAMFIRQRMPLDLENAVEPEVGKQLYPEMTAMNAAAKEKATLG